jgi:hypothetical protein
MTEFVNPVDQLFPVIAEAVQEWKKVNTPAVITEKVKRALDRSNHEVTLKLLGFKNNYGDWELDHCNGRSGNSAAGDYLRSTQQAAIQDWFATNLMPVLSPTALKRLQKQMNDEYLNTLHNALRKVVIEKATKDANLLIADLSKDTNSDKFFKLMNLVASTT